MDRKPKMRYVVYCSFLASIAFVSCLASHAEAQVEAYVGQPFGIGRIVLRVPEGQLPEPLGAAGISITEDNGRVFYPVIETPPDTTVVRKLLVESPLMRGGPVRREVGGIIQSFLDQTPPTTIYFLFTGNQPLRLTIGTKVPQRRVVRPMRSQPGINRLAKLWWEQYTARPKTILGLKKSDYPPVVRSYLESMLSARLGLSLPPLDDKDPTQAMLEEQLGLMLGTEAIQTAMIRDRMLGDPSLSEMADLPLPVAAEWPPLGELDVKKDVKIEPIAMRVPEECFYIRFGNYGNFVWLQDMMKRWGGDAGNLIALRGLDYESNQRMEQHLLVKQTTLGRMLGGTLISDVAMIGTDLFMREGASFGLLFEARNTFLLDQEFASQRAARVKEGGVTEEKIEIDGKKVSFIHSADDTVRSFYLADNGYVLITSSKEVMRRFIATGKKQPEGALGATREFRHARTVMPTSRDDTVFAYFSDAFFRNMASPHYWVEVRRRLEAVADIEVLQMAQLAGVGEDVPISQTAASVPPLSGPQAEEKDADAKGESSAGGLLKFFGLGGGASAESKEKKAQREGEAPAEPLSKPSGSAGASPSLSKAETDVTTRPVPAEEIVALKQLKLLPKNFGPRPDGSEPVLDSQGRLIDSLRGRRGFFVPVPDVPVKKITAAEAAAYRRFLQFYHEKWGRLDPMIVGVRRKDIGRGQDQITIDAQANPFAKKHYETLMRRTGPADSQKLAPVEGNIIDFQVVLPDQYLFAGLQDVQLPSLATGQSVPGGAGQSSATPPTKVGLTDVFVGYIGTTGQLGILSLFQALVMPAERIPGMQEAGLQNGPQLHKINSGQFTLFSFQQWLLEQVRPQLHFVEAERPAQLRLDVGDVAKAKITPTLNRLSYMRTRTTSLGNLRLLHSLQQQMRVPAGECLTVAENLLDAKLVCSLGGKYELITLQRGGGRDVQQRWTSTSLEARPGGSSLEIPIPRDYVGPPLSWFRGLKLDAAMMPEQFSIHAELIMELPK